MKNFYTYLYRDLDGTPLYVGKGNDKRAWKHRSSKSHLGLLLRKRAKVGFIIQPEIVKCADENTAFATEIFWIAVYGRLDLDRGTLLNRTDGGDGISGHAHSQEAKDKIAAFRIGKPGPNKGKPAHNKGKIGNSPSQETRDKIAALKIGIPRTGKAAKGIPKTGKGAKGIPKPRRILRMVIERFESFP